MAALSGVAGARPDHFAVTDRPTQPTITLLMTLSRRALRVAARAPAPIARAPAVRRYATAPKKPAPPAKGKDKAAPAYNFNTSLTFDAVADPEVGPRSTP